MKITTKLTLTLLIIGVVLMGAACEKPDDKSEAKPEINETRVARYAVNVYDTMDTKKREHYVATLNKAEEVKLISLEEHQGEKGENDEYAKIRLSDGKEGFVESKHIAKKAVVLIQDLRLYNRPNITSGITTSSKNAKKGMVGFVTDDEYNNGEWMEIKGGSWPDTYFNGWVKNDGSVSEDLKLIADAVLLEKTMDAVNKGDGKISTKLMNDLNMLKDNSSSPISDIASEVLTKNESRGNMDEESEDESREDGSDNQEGNAAPATTENE